MFLCMFLCFFFAFVILPSPPLDIIPFLSVSHSYLVLPFFLFSLFLSLSLCLVLEVLIFGSLSCHTFANYKLDSKKDKLFYNDKLTLYTSLLIVIDYWPTFHGQFSFSFHTKKNWLIRNISLWLLKLVPCESGNLIEVNLTLWFDFRLELILIIVTQILL